jgi:protease secretion system outer membrane protein
MKKSLLAVSTALLMSNANALDLMQAYDLALVNDPAYKVATKEFEAGDANRIIGRAGLLPQVSANFYQASNATRISQTGYSTTNMTYPSTNGGVQLTQALVNLNAWASAKQGYAQADMARSKFVHNSQELLVRTTQAYTEVLFYRDQITYYTAQRDAYREQVTINERRLRAGDGTVTEVLETKASFELADVQVIEAKDNLENARRKLEAMMGVKLNSATEVKKLSTNFKVSPVAMTFDQWQDTALSNNAEIAAAKNSEEAAKQEYNKQISNNAPVISAIAQYNQQSSYYVSTINQTANSTMVGVQATWQLSNGGQTYGLTKQANANWEKAQADTEAVRSRVITELRRQYDLVVSSRQKVAALERAVESGSELTKAMRKSVQAGERISVDVLLAEKVLVTAQKDLAQAKYTYLASTLKLKQLAGNLTVQDLEVVAGNFERDANAPKVTALEPQQVATSTVTVHKLVLPDLLAR